MVRCIQLARNSRNTAAPNPMVGCVIVHEDIIIGEGYTSPFGGPHAEVNAIESVMDKSLLCKATLYVSLEPCSHFGKTPPCADLILKHNIPRVVIGVRDPNPVVAGNGINRLIEAGCEVIDGVLKEECLELNRRFITFHQHRRPYIILKWAQSSDGFMAPEPETRNTQPEPYWITNSYSRQVVHQWRSEEGAILVGTRTALHDNPRLNLREWKGKAPIRIVLDKDLVIPSTYHLMDGTVRTIVMTESNDKSKQIQGIDYENFDFSRDLPQQLCRVLYDNQILSLIVEGGAITLNAFIKADLWDEARVFTGQKSFESGIRAPEIEGKTIKEYSISNDLLKFIRND